MSCAIGPAQNERWCKMTYAEFIEKHKLKLSVTSIPVRPDAKDNDWGKTAFHYIVTVQKLLENGKTGKHFATFYSKGAGHVEKSKFPKHSFHWKEPKPILPKLDEVLDSFALDIQCAQGDFDEFCIELGYDNDSISALNTYNACKNSHKQLLELLGRYGLSELLADVERL